MDLGERTFDGMMREMLEKTDEPRIPATVEELQKNAAFFDGRTFEPGTLIMKRRDSKDGDKGGLCIYRYPIRGEPALVLDVVPAEPSVNGYNKETLVILIKHGHGNYARITVDPVYFEVYVPEDRTETPSEVETTDPATV